MNKHIQDFLNRKDSCYKFRPIHISRSDDLPVVIAELELTSQHWQESEQANVDFPVWKHRLTVYLPVNSSGKPCLLMLFGGTRHAPDLEIAPAKILDAAKLCSLTQAPVAILKDIPNQPLSYAGEKPRTEDDLVAETWKQFMGDSENNLCHPLQWPMVRSVMRAMDAITDFASQQNTEINDFVVSGGSKRGWVSWLTAAADFRVSAVIPMVIDVLNVQSSIRHHINVYGGFAEAIGDYADDDHNILENLESAEAEKLMTHIDPLNYRDTLLLPKFIINASCDEFFPPDSARFYYQQLQPPVWLRYLPNASHYLGRDSNVDLDELMASTFGALTSEEPMPEMRWQMLDDGGLEIRADSEPLSAKIWQCHNPDARDFRKDVLQAKGLQYESREITTASCQPWVYQYYPEQPASGWTAYFIELTFDNDIYPDLKMTTGIRIIPDIYDQ